MVVETPFPRGGTDAGAKKPLETETDSPIIISKTEKKNSKHLKKPGESKTFRKTKGTSNSKVKQNQSILSTEALADDEDVLVPTRLATKQLCKGMLLLGAVREVRDYELKVNLPNNMTGVVPITNMADSYTTLLKRFAQSSGDGNLSDELCSLEELFSVGQIVPCVCVDEVKDNNVVPLSLNPKVIHQNLSAGHLTTNSVFYGVVAGIEDHGCTVDIGLPNITAFMPTTMRTDLKVGMIRRFTLMKSDVLALESGESRSVSVSLRTEEDKSEVVSKKEVAFNSLTPGKMVEVRVLSRKPQGLVVSLGGQLKAYVHVTHLSQHVKDYSVDKPVQLRVLAVHTSTKYIHLTDLPSLIKDIDQPGEGSINIPQGEPVNITVSKIVDKYAFVTSPDGHVTYIGVSLLPEKTIADMKKKKTSEVTLKCYWYNWDYLEQRPVFTTSKPKASQSVLPSLHPGDMVEAKITSFSDLGAKVQLTNGLYAFIQNIHLTEVPLKKPEKKLKVAEKLRCRVWSVDQKRKRVRLTAKPSLVSSELPPLDSLEGAKPGALVRGVIVKITTGALVSFYNNTLGFVASSMLAKHPIDKPEESFYVGQAVTCRVVSVDAASDKLALTFILDDDVPQSIKRKAADSVTDVLEVAPKKTRMRDVIKGVPLALGQTVNSFSVSSVTAKHFTLVSPEGHKAILPLTHLSDQPTLSALLAQTVREGDTLDGLVCVADDPSTIVSKQLVMQHFSSAARIPQHFEDLQVGELYAGIVCSHSEFGVFVMLSGDLIGLVPLRELPAGCQESVAANLLPVGRTVVAKLLSLDNKKKRFVLALREKPCHLPPSLSDLPYLSLRRYFYDVKSCLNSQPNDKLRQYRVGDLVKVEVTQVGEGYMHLVLEDGVEGKASGSLIAGCKAEKGKKLTAMVVYRDLNTNSLEVLLDRKYVDGRRKFANSHRTSGQVKVNQNLKCDVIYVCPDYILCMLKSHAFGQLVSVPGMQHPNSVQPAVLLYGEEAKVTIKLRNSIHCDAAVIKTTPAGLREEDGDLAVGVLHTEEEKKLSAAEPIVDPSQIPDLPSVGSVLDAVISCKTPLQLNLCISGGEIKGRVFVNELSDSPQINTCPLDSFQPGEKIRVKVRAFKPQAASNHPKQASADRDKTVILECSLRESCMKPGSSRMPLTKALVIGRIHYCFITKHDVKGKHKSVHVITDDSREAIIAVRDLGVRFEDPKMVTDRFPLGYCIRAKIDSVSKSGQVQMRAIPEETVINQTPAVPATVTECHISTGGVLVSCRLGSRCKIPLSELSQPGVDIDIDKFAPGKSIDCYLVKKSRHGAIILSLRADNDVIPISKVKCGMVLPAFVSSISSQAITVVSSGHMMSLEMKESERKSFCSCKRLGSACYIQVESLSKGNLITAKLVEEPSTANSLSPTSTAKVKSKRKVKHEDEQKETGRDQTEIDLSPPKQKKKKEQVKLSTVTVETDVSKSAKITQAPKATLKRDADSGISIFFKKNSEEKGATTSRLDFAASMNSLATESRQKSDVEEKLESLQHTGKHLPKHQYSPTKPKVGLNRFTQPKLTSSEAHNEVELLALLKVKPDSGQTWCKLIEFTAQVKGIESARARAEQALETISYRLEDEKLLVWAQFLKIELVHGTEDSFDNIKRRATQQMDERKVYQELVKVYTKLDRTQDVETSYSIMLRKWSEVVSVWTDYGQFYFSSGKLEAARNLLQRCLKTLPNKTHIEVIMKFAQMEMQHGDVDRFTSLFENILSNFPKRTDVWSVYIDQLIKAEQITLARSVFRRAITQKLSAKKQQSFNKRFIEFETQHGTEQSVKEAEELIKAVS